LPGPEHYSAFSAVAHAKAKFLLLGHDDPHFAELKAEARSFPIEHVSPVSLVQQEISRRTPHGQRAGLAFSRGLATPDQTVFAVMRKWFWGRKPDAGFLLEGFPATLLQAKMIDEWLETRGETLTAVIATPSAPADVISHYRTQGMLFASLCPAA
jgi:adenylate kinase